MPKCCNCKESKHVEEFARCNYHKSGHSSCCKTCSRAYAKIYYKNNKEKMCQSSVKWREKNKDYIQNKKKHKKGLKNDFISKSQIPHGRTKEEAKIYNKTYHHDYNINNKANIKIVRRAYRSHLKKEDMQFRVQRNLQSRLWAAMRSNTKVDATMKLLSCPLDFFLRWLERNFEQGMSWANYGYGDDKWNIDHNLPCASFDLVEPEQQRACFHWTNLFPMWQKHNFVKGDSIQPIDYQI